MINQLEHELRDLFAEDAEGAPTAHALAATVRRRIHRRRQIRMAWATGALAAAAVTAVVATALPAGQPNSDRQATHDPVVGGTGALPDGGMASCIEQYSPATLAGRAFAFDGTVTDISRADAGRRGTDPELVAVTFAVNEWYSGGSGATVTVDMTAPDLGAQDSTGTPPVAYEVGTRLLVSGAPRWGGPALSDAIAWGCGFTRYYDEDTASTWRAVFG